MSDEHRKFYMKKGTGTVPKIKHRNNTSGFNQEQGVSNVLANNLGRDTDRPEYFRHYRVPDRNSHFAGFTMMDSTPDQNTLRQNGINTSNGTSTPNTSRTNSRRNSVGTVPKCDNISKYPDKKQIEQKLGQIREYLRVTSSLMTNMKNTEEQSEEEKTERENIEIMYNDLIDSEAKLVTLLDDIDAVQENSKDGPLDLSLDGNVVGLSKNELEQKVEATTREMQMLKEQENLLLHLQLNAESQLREARHAQDKLLKGHNQGRNMNLETESLHNGYNDSIDAISNSGASSKNFNENHMDMVKELEERLKSLNSNVDSAKNSGIPDQYHSQIDSLQGRILQIREGNDNRSQLIQMLDNRDAQLQAEHSVLQGKLMELQNKKMQVDQLVFQLQNMNEESEDEEVGNQVKRIVNMKEQLAKLKDMLNIVQNTENAIEMQNINESDVEEHVRRVCTKTDNLLQKDGRLNRSQMEHNSSHLPNEQRVKEKQVNKKTMNANERERIKLQAELQAKKRELEELMCKHKAATSNLNQDVNSENKSDLGACGIPLFDGATNSWCPVPTNIYNMPQTNERYSSDECPEDEMNEYSEVNSSGELNLHSVQPMPSLNYSASNYTKRREEEPRLEIPSDFLRTASRTPERSVRSASITTPLFQPDRSCSNVAASKNQIQKQLELIKTVCDSMLEDTSGNQRSQVHVRNNLTPSPIYTEPRQYTSPNAHPWNALNVVNPTPENMPMPTVPPFPTGDTGNYQNWLTTNTLQTQAFMLNTLNQCCQMLWLQQRELSTLRSTVNMIQERFQNGTFEMTSNSDPHCLISNPCLYSSVPTVPVPNSQPNNQYRPTTNQLKVINPPVVGATSMPNLNHAHCSQTNMDHACANHCNLQNARILDSALNNSVNNHTMISDQVNNSAAMQSLPSQVWNGQALNNQVAPGNRANNYWDNFRSYSRQNLLSTKSNEGLHNASLTTERTNNSLERTQQFFATTQTVPKLNTDHQEGSTTTSTENTPRRTHSKVSRQRSNSSVAGAVPPDVLNVNQNQPMQKTNEPAFSLDFNSIDNASYHPLLSTSNSETYTEPQDLNYKDRTGALRNRNEWHDDSQSENNSPKCKLFEELRENVYKEVASLISANQGRPHFLIQLFRDLQLISSDPLRRRTLQSIQSVITNSLPASGNPTGATRQVASRPRPENEELPVEPVGPLTVDFFDMQPFSWPQLPKTQKNETEIEPNGQEHLSEVLSFLNSHNDDIFSDSLVHSLRDTLVESTFSAIFTNTSTKDGIIQKHFASLLTEALEQYRGKKVQDVRINVLQTVEDLLRGEISLIRLMRETISESEMNSLESAVPQFEVPMPLVIDEGNNPQIQNEELAEADQSRAEMDEEDEGAVGGVLNILLDCSSGSNTGQVVNDDIDIPKVDLVLNTEADVEFAEQGLDQVPTRLTTHGTSRSNTPSKDKKNTRMDGTDHF